MTAPLALLVTACSFLCSAFMLALIRAPEPEPVVPAARPGVRREIGEGLRVVLGNPLPRAIAGCTATVNLFSSLSSAVYILFLTRELALSPTVIGLLLSAAGPGGMLGAILAARAAQRFGIGPVIVGAQALGGLFWLLATALFGIGLTGTLYNVTQVSLRQQLTPDHPLGRMNATMRFLVWGTLPIGALLGGFLGGAFGLLPALLVGATGALGAFLWVLFSPVRALREVPALEKGA